MSILAIMGWIIIGIVTSSIFLMFWDEIKTWLNNSAANAVEKVLGYDARERMHRAVVSITRLADKIKNTTIVYSKSNSIDKYYDKTTLISEASIYEIDNKIIEEINEKGQLIQEFEYIK